MNQNESSLDTQTILLVEDDHDFAEMAIQQIEGAGFHVIHFASAAGAIRIVKEEGVAAIVSDHNMPHISGLEFLLLVRSLKLKTPFFLLTANHEIKEKHAFQLGANGLFRKPASWPHVISAIKIAISDSAKNKKPAAKREIKRGRL